MSVRSRIVDLVIRRGAVSKAEIGLRLSLSRPTVLTAIAELMAGGILCESGEYDSTGGRRAKAISAVSSYRFFAGIDITANHVAFVIIDWTGVLVASARKRIRFEDTVGYYDAVAREFALFRRRSGVSKECISSVGFSVPGILSFDRRTLVRSHALKVRNLDLNVLVSRFAPLEVDFENDANAAALAESSVDEAEASFLLSLSNTVGGAFTASGGLCLGTNRRSGEVGHMILHPGGRRCYCGKCGCADAYLSALLLAGKAASLEDFFARIELGDRVLSKTWNAYLDDLAILVSNLRMAYDCEIVLGGYVGSQMGSHLADLRHRVAAYDLFGHEADYVRLARRGKEAAAIGVALIFRDRHVASL